MFDLHITCTKDITFLKIDFADGTTVLGEKPNKVSKSAKSENASMQKFDDYDNFEQHKQYKKVKLPDIEDKHRDSVKIANELQNLEI